MMENIIITDIKLENKMIIKTEQDTFDQRLEPDVVIDCEDSSQSFSSDRTSSTELTSITKEEVDTSNFEIGYSQLRPCPICKKYFKRLESHLLLKHENENCKEAPYLCTFCTKRFKNLSNLNVHIRSHTGIKPYICIHCNKGFTQSGNLMHHLRIHSGSKPYKCHVCQKAFTQPGNLNNHLRLHINEKPFQCHLCSRAFTQSSNLNSHLRNNHKELSKQ